MQLRRTLSGRHQSSGAATFLVGGGRAGRLSHRGHVEGFASLDCHVIVRQSSEVIDLAARPSIDVGEIAARGAAFLRLADENLVPRCCSATNSSRLAGAGHSVGASFHPSGGDDEERGNPTVWTGRGSPGSSAHPGSGVTLQRSTTGAATSSESWHARQCDRCKLDRGGTSSDGTSSPNPTKCRLSAAYLARTSYLARTQSAQWAPSHQRCQVPPSVPVAKTSRRSAPHEDAAGVAFGSSSPPSDSHSCHFVPSQ